MGEARTEPAENFSQGVWILFRKQIERFLKSMITLEKQKEFLEDWTVNWGIETGKQRNSFMGPSFSRTDPTIWK